MKMNYKYKVGQKLFNEQVGEIKVMHRWKGKDLNFYDVMDKGMRYLTFDETQMISGYNFGQKKFVAKEEVQCENEEWCVMCLNNKGVSWFIKEEKEIFNYWTSDIEKANVFSRKESEELATKLMCSLGRGSYYAKRKK